MTLEDFFSLTKMKDGLTVPSRVEELVGIMQKEKDFVVKNIGDATRQWAVVASALSATENRDCLDRFIQLDGLGLIDRWLKQVQKFGNNTNEDFVEESITAMMGALEKLHIDYELSVSSGIWITVKSLLGHSSSQVQDRARALFDSWNQGRVSEALDHDVKCVGFSQDDNTAVSSIQANESRTESSAIDVPLPQGSVNEENNGAEPSGPEKLPVNSECLQPEKEEDVKTKTDNNELCSHGKLDDIDMEGKPPDHVATSKLSNSVLENSAMEDKFPEGTVETISSVEACRSPAPKQCCKEEQSDTLKTNEFSKDEKHVPKVSSFPENICEKAFASSSMVESRNVSSAVEVASAHEIMTGSAVGKHFDTDEGDLDPKDPALGDLRKLASEPKNRMDDVQVINNCSTPMFKPTGEDDDYQSDAMQDSSGNECTYGKHKDLETSFSRIKDIGAADKDKDHVSDGDSDSRNDFHFSKATMATRNPDATNRRESDIELEYGIVDALEVARKVALEYREPSCSSSDKILGGGIRPPESPDSVNEKLDLADEVPVKELPTERNYSAEAYPEGEGQLINSDNRVAEPENGIADMDSSQVTEAAREPEVNRDKGLCDFDLNQEVCSDDMDNPVNPVNHVSTPVSVVSASRPAVAPGLPVAPLQFEGTLGWKGTAATSAFRPASPRRISDSDKTTLIVGGTNNSSKQRQDCLDIDLNVAESEDEKLADLIPEKQIPVSSGLQSAESSVEVSPRRSERLNLDLNRISDDSDAPPSDLRMERRLLYNRNGHRSPSPASSSSSMQPLLRNFDLNDRPFLQNDTPDPGPYHGKSSQSVNPFGLPKPDDPVISIMGARVEVNRKEFIPQISCLPNGKSLETAMDGNLARGGGVLGLGPPAAYSNSPLFGYNGFAAASTLSYSSPMYGPGSTIPYMVDSRGAPVVPQIVGSAAAVPPSYSQPPPFIVSVAGAPSAITGPLRPNFDLNSGFPTEGGNRDSLGLRQLFMPGQGRSMEEHLRTSSQPSSSSGAGGKRKEPDGGWETYPLNYRHQQPPWN